MGMIACFAPVDAKTLADLRANPETMEDFLYPDDGESEPPGCIDIDKSWHGIHFMLTGEAWGGTGPLALAVLGGEEVGEDAGYGPARVLTPAQVSEVAAALAALSDEEFRARYAPAAMTAAEVYPDVIWERDGDEALDYVAEYFTQVRQFYIDAAARGDGAVLWLC